MNLSCSDFTGSHWFSAFNDQGIALLGKTADELQELKDSMNPDYEATWQASVFKPYVLKVRAKAETWQDETRVKCTIMEVKPVDWREGATEIRNLIRDFGL